MTQLTLGQNNHLTIAGELNFANIAAVYRSGLNYIQQSRELIIDFKQAKPEDSSALAMLITWLRIARKSKIALHYINLPEHLLEMAKLSHLDAILSVKHEVNRHG